MGCCFIAIFVPNVKFSQMITDLKKHFIVAYVYVGLTSF